jgi:hypothetical protein
MRYGVRIGLLTRKTIHGGYEPVYSPGGFPSTGSPY